MNTIRGKRDKRLLMAFVWRECTDYTVFHNSSPREQLKAVVKYTREVMRCIDAATDLPIIDNVNVNSLGNTGCVVRTLTLCGNLDWTNRWQERKNMEVNLPPGSWSMLPFQKNARYGMGVQLINPHKTP